LPFDALVMAAVAAEIAALVPARVDRVYRAGTLPGAAEAVLVLFRPGVRTQLVISLHPRFARVHLSLRERPPAPPSPFVLLLRKHLEGARLEGARQYDRDRILWLEFTGPLGARFRLVVEIMGPGSNLILLDGQARVLGAWREEGARPGAGRRVLVPGVDYEPPPPPAGWGTFADRELDERLRMVRASAGPGAVAGADRERVVEEMWQEVATHPQPVLIADEEGRQRDYWCLVPLAHGPAGRRYGSMSELLDEFYRALEEEEQLKTRRARLERVLRRHRQRQERLVEALLGDLERAREALKYRRWGELLLAQAAHLPAGHEHVRVTDYYLDEPREVEIPLDPALSARDNAREFFRRYARARRALGTVESRLQRETARLAHLEQLEEALTGAAGDTLEVVEREMHAAGLLPEKEDRPGAALGSRGARGARGGEQARAAGGGAAGRVLRFFLPGGEEVMVGRGAEANDFVTFVLGRPDDVWLHVRGIPGSHVILRPPPGRAASPEAISRAAAIAAHFSRARDAAKVEVDWTLRKHVRRRPGAAPGQVLYREERTLLVKPAPPPGVAGGDP
jgi:predicted ribosome quality control (RQC) complex YloA/Tae2 family protein